MKDSDTFLSFHEFKERYDVIETNYLAFHGLLSALKTLRNKIRAPVRNNTNTEYESFYTKFMKANKPSKQAYKKLSGNVCKSGPLHFGSEKSFPSNFTQETILGHK